MVDRPRPSPAAITQLEFDDALAKYDQLIEAVSASKGGKKGPGLSRPICFRRLMRP